MWFCRVDASGANHSFEKGRDFGGDDRRVGKSQRDHPKSRGPASNVSCLKTSLARTVCVFFCLHGFLTRRTRVPSPVVPVPGVGQVGHGLQNTWGLEEDEDNEEGSDEEEEEKMEEKRDEKKAESTLGRM